MRGLETSGGARVRSPEDGEKKRGGPPRVRERRSSTLPVRVRSDAGVGVGSASSAPSTVGSASGGAEAASVIAATTGVASTSEFIAGVAPSAPRSSFSAAASASRKAELPSLDATRVRRRDDTRRLFVVPKDAAASTTTRVVGRTASRPVPTRVLATTAVARAVRVIAALVIVFVFPLPPRCAQGSADASISDSRATCRSQPRVWTDLLMRISTDREQCSENLGVGRFAAPLARVASHANHSFDAYRALEDVRWASRGQGSSRTRQGMPDADSYLLTRCRILRSPGFSRSFSCSSRSSPRPPWRTQTTRVDAAL